ncbi:MAG: citramalate synthase [Trueperaceae bacterium]|nr:citramalate synthase [Trueperaceae bacterium]
MTSPTGPLAGVRIELYDTTLRDGTQGEGVSFTSDDKVAVARRLDAFGVDLIEGGWPGSNPRDVEFFERMRSVPLQHARLAAFGATRRRDVAPEDDANLRALVAAATPVVTVFGKSWPLHVTEALGATLDENLAMIADSVRFLGAQGREVVYDAEHFYDGWRADPAYALATLEAAVGAGARTVVLCDTNGGSLPGDVAAGLAAARAAVGADVLLGIHPHDDAGLAVANALAALRAGARHVQGTVNGYGERCGNVDLLTVLANLVLKLGADQPQPLGELRALSRYVDERANLEPNVRRPYVGDAAFAHKGGVHVSAVNRRPDTYEHVPPERVGQVRRVLLSDLSGRANLVAKGAELGGGDAAALVARLKELEHLGYAFEGAEASFRLVARRLRGEHRPFFDLHGYTVVIDKREGDGAPRCEATVRVAVGDVAAHTAADGDGPVNALDRALRKALIAFYPTLADLALVDYKVRVLSGPATGTASVVRVHVETSDGRTTWGTVGAHSNIIDASYEALLDAIESKLLADGVEGVARPPATGDAQVDAGAAREPSERPA